MQALTSRGRPKLWKESQDIIRPTWPSSHFLKSVKNNISCYIHGYRGNLSRMVWKPPANRSWDKISARTNIHIQRLCNWEVQRHLKFSPSHSKMPFFFVMVSWFWFFMEEPYKRSPGHTMQQHPYIFKAWPHVIIPSPSCLIHSTKKSPPLSHRQHHSPSQSSTSPRCSQGEGRHWPIWGGRQDLGGLECLWGGTAAGLQRVNRTLGDGGMEEEG